MIFNRDSHYLLAHQVIIRKEINMHRYYMFNKPKGCVTAKTDALHKTVMDYFPSDIRNELHPIGRLDKDTEGMLLITDDGSLTHYLMQPASHVTKTYFFYAIGTLTEEKRDMIRKGVFLQGQTLPTLPAEIICTSTGRITDIIEYLPEKKRDSLLKNPSQKIFSGYITICEGKNHQVKRMLRAIDCCIMYLKRISIGDVHLDPSLASGTYRPLTDEELSHLTQRSV